MVRYVVNKQKTGNLINDHIQRINISLENLAVALGFESPRVIYEWLRGNKQPSLVTAYNLSIIFNCKIEDLIVFEKK